MVFFGFGTTNFDHDGVFVRLSVGSFIPHIVQVQDSHAQESDGGGRQKQQPFHFLGIQKVDSHRAHQSEEHEHEQVAKTPVSVSGVPHRVANGRGYGQDSQDQEKQGVPNIGIPEGMINQQHCGYQGQSRSQDNDTFHGCGRNRPALDGALRPYPVGVVGSFCAIAVIIGKIGQYLQAERGQHRQGKDCPAEDFRGRVNVVGRPERIHAAHNYSRYRQRQGSQSGGFNPMFHFISIKYGVSSIKTLKT